MMTLQRRKPGHDDGTLEKNPAITMAHWRKAAMTTAHWRKPGHNDDTLEKPRL